MIELFRQARAGTLSLDDPLPIRNQFRSIVDESPYPQRGRGLRQDLYTAIGETLTLRQINEAMIT